MKRWSALVAVIVVGVLALGAPLAMASSNCMAMGAMCEGPCGASSCTVAQFGNARVFQQMAAQAIPWVDHVSSAPLTVAERPPKSASSLA